MDQAQAESEAAYKRAQDAQRHAREKATQAANAEQDAINKQAEAQRAEQRARQLRSEAEDAQRRALEEGQQASEEAQRAQERALNAQPRAQAQTQAMGPTTQAEGVVRSTNANEIVIDRENAPPLYLRVDRQETTVLRDGQTASLGDLQPGTKVDVTYRVERDQPVAQMIESGRRRPARQNEPREL